jgi:threonine dehydrogenase-like Zn-dependent dehydrogenase
LKALTWHGKRDVRVDNVPDPTIREPTDAVVRMTTTAICGSDLHLYELLTPFMEEGDILGHEPMGIVEEVGPEVTNLSVGDRVVIPFQVSCGHCFMCERGLQTQCETTQVRAQVMGAALFGYTKLYGELAGGQAEYLRVPQAHYTHIKVPEGPPDERFVYLSDVLPTSWQAVAYADIPEGGSVTVLGLGPIGDMSSRIAKHLGFRVIAVDLVPHRIERARQQGIEVLDLGEHDDVAGEIREMTQGRGTDSVIDAVAMEAPRLARRKPRPAEDDLYARFGGGEDDGEGGLRPFERLLPGHRRGQAGGTISLIGVYGGQADPLPMLTLFDKQIKLTMDQANVKRWVEDIMPLLTGDGDPLGVEGFHTHQLPLEDAPRGYDIFQKKEDDAVKVLLKP